MNRYPKKRKGKQCKWCGMYKDSKTFHNDEVCSPKCNIERSKYRKHIENHERSISC